MKSKNLKELVILHSNDIHGTFEGETDENGKLCHSLAQAAGYVKKIKTENPDTIYCIAGDVFQGSLLDSDFQGMSTMDMLNLIDIDVMSIGNHELDYGVSHLMFASRYADFPILNANFRIGLQEFYFINSKAVLDQTNEELLKAADIKMVSEDAFETLKDYLTEHKGLGGRIDNRIIIK